MEVLVTGAAGFIGRNLVLHLLSKGYRVRAFVLPGDCSTWQQEPRVQAIEGDIRDFARVKTAVSGVRQVYHLAALTSPDPHEPEALHDINVTGTRNVARAALECGVDRLVYTSSVAVHGRRIRRHDMDENSPARPDSAYARSKLQSEQLLNSMHSSDGLPVVIARTSNVFGPGVLDWLNFFQVIQAGQFRFIGAGQGLMHFTAAEDLCEGLWLCGTRPGVEGNTYILTGGESIRLREWIEMIRSEVGGTIRTPAIPVAPLHVYNAFNSMAYAMTGRELPRSDRLILFLSDRSFNISRARAELGYNPNTPSLELVRKTTEWYRSRGWLD